MLALIHPQSQPAAPKAGNTGGVTKHRLDVIINSDRATFGKY